MQAPQKHNTQTAPMERVGQAFFKHVRRRKWRASGLLQNMARSVESGHFQTPPSFETLTRFALL